MAHQTWNTALYDGKHNFVSKYGEEILALLAPQPGENILDVGCGTGDHSVKAKALDIAEARLFKTHCQDGQWFADYRRIRVAARKQS